MNQFDSFYRFFRLADDNKPLPMNMNLPTDRALTLPVVLGDRLRFLVDRADVGGERADQLTIGLRTVGTDGPGTLVGTLREQAATHYTEVMLRIDGVPADGSYRQFALMVGEQVLVGTFRGSYADAGELARAVAAWLRAFPFGLIEVDEVGRMLRVRIYDNDTVRLRGQMVRIGVGQVLERNENSPSLLAQKATGVIIPAQNRYTLAAGADIQKGNVFVLDSKRYVATGVERPVDILTALGLTDGQLTEPGGNSLILTGNVIRPATTPLIAYAQPGQREVSNTNRPTLQLLFDSNSGGQDRYVATVGTDIQPGNVYQITASGVVSKTATATTLSTPATLASVFNSTGGFYSVATGVVPVVTVVVGMQTIANTNNPTLGITLTVNQPERVVDRYTVFVGPSVRVGNSFSVQTGTGEPVVVTATAVDTPLDIVRKLGYSSNPFLVEVSAGRAVTTLARKGPRYGEADVTGVSLLSSRSFHGLPFVAEIAVPGLANGYYQMVLRKANVVVAIGNNVDLRTSPKNTTLVRFGPDGVRSVFGLAYAEDGIMQQVRLPIYLDSPTLQQSESVYKDLDNRTVRGRTTAEESRALTTTVQPVAFHRNLWMALKHPLLFMDGQPVRCEGDYRQTEPIGRRRRRQGQADIRTRTTFDYQPTYDPLTDSLSGNYALIERMQGVEGLYIAAKRLSFVQVLATGGTLPAADYELLIRTGTDALRLNISHKGSRVATFLLAPNRLNRVGPVRLEAGRVTLWAEVEPVTVASTTGEPYYPQRAMSIENTIETIGRKGDFGPDYNQDFSQL